jgi:hypothetical protein
LEINADAETLEFTFAFEQKSVRIGERDFGETNAIAGAKLRRNTKINCHHVRYFRITADGLAISQKQNRLSARRNLDCARRDCFGD